MRNLVDIISNVDFYASIPIVKSKEALEIYGEDTAPSTVPLGKATLSSKLNIPVTDHFETDEYEKRISWDYELPKSYVRHVKKMSGEADVALDYNCEADDLAFIRTHPRFQEKDIAKFINEAFFEASFEASIDLLEQHTGHAKDPVPLTHAQQIAHEKLQWPQAITAKLIPEIYNYWSKKRERLGKPLLRLYWPVTNSTDSNPYLVFRPRDKERYRLRKQARKNDSESFWRMHTLRREFHKGIEMLQLVVERERLKQAQVEISAHIFHSHLRDSLGEAAAKKIDVAVLKSPKAAAVSIVTLGKPSDKNHAQAQVPKDKDKEKAEQKGSDAASSPGSQTSNASNINGSASKFPGGIFKHTLLYEPLLTEPEPSPHQAEDVDMAPWLDALGHGGVGGNHEGRARGGAYGGNPRDGSGGASRGGGGGGGQGDGTADNRARKRQGGGSGGGGRGGRNGESAAAGASSYVTGASGRSDREPPLRKKKSDRDRDHSGGHGHGGPGGAVGSGAGAAGPFRNGHAGPPRQVRTTTDLMLVRKGLNVPGPQMECRPAWPAFVAEMRTRERMCLSGSLNDYLDDLELHRHVDADGDTQLPLKYRCRGRVGRGGRLVMDRLPVYDSVWRPDPSNPGSHIRYSAFPASAAAQQNQTDPRQQAAANHAAWAGVAFPRAVSSFTHHYGRECTYIYPTSLRDFDVGFYSCAQAQGQAHPAGSFFDTEMDADESSGTPVVGTLATTSSSSSSSSSCCSRVSGDSTATATVAKPSTEQSNNKRQEPGGDVAAAPIDVAMAQKMKTETEAQVQALPGPPAHTHNLTTAAQRSTSTSALTTADSNLTTFSAILSAENSTTVSPSNGPVNATALSTKESEDANDIGTALLSVSALALPSSYSSSLTSHASVKTEIEVTAAPLLSASSLSILKNAARQINGSSSSSSSCCATGPAPAALPGDFSALSTTGRPPQAHLWAQLPPIALMPRGALPRLLYSRMDDIFGCSDDEDDKVELAQRSRTRRLRGSCNGEEVQIPGAPVKFTLLV